MTHSIDILFSSTLELRASSFENGLFGEKHTRCYMFCQRKETRTKSSTHLPDQLSTTSTLPAFTVPPKPSMVSSSSARLA
jgi:hypothetical protein